MFRLNSQNSGRLTEPPLRILNAVVSLQTGNGNLEPVAQKRLGALLSRAMGTSDLDNGYMKWEEKAVRQNCRHRHLSTQNIPPKRSLASLNSQASGTNLVPDVLFYALLRIYLQDLRVRKSKGHQRVRNLPMVSMIFEKAYCGPLPALSFHHVHESSHFATGGIGFTLTRFTRLLIALMFSDLRH